MSWFDHDEPFTYPEPSPALKLAGYRRLEDGTLRSYVEWKPGDGWEPVFTGGPEVVAPLLAALIALADDRTESASASREAFLWHRLQAQIALGQFVAAGGELP